ncbi:hypothetical protein ScPMuIL_012910 [Solemya velum]
MATFFGEVLQVTSRAVDEDDDDEYDEEIISPCEMRWSVQTKTEIENGQKLTCSILIVAVGPAASGFASSYILHDNFDRVGVLFSGMNERDVNTFSQKSITDKTCYIYRSQINKQLFVCQCNSIVLPEQAHPWVCELFHQLNVENCEVIVLNTAVTSTFRSEIPASELSTPFVKALWTSSFKGRPPFTSLEQPNVVSGLASQILSYCEVQHVRALLCMCYTESMMVDIPTLKSFKPVLEFTPLKGLIKEKSKC